MSFRLPHSAAPYVSGALTSGFMSLLVTTVATWRALGFTPDFGTRAFNAWLSAWPIAFAALLVVAPVVRRIVARLVAPASAPMPATAQNPRTSP